ncbi:unnamed protein product [Lepeophtheirus salmonis]|uniref:(salmon louse) hypothetical protein n=1 Tax=Lepeophtheirus salmonis TaxID=72036 RepID=A0A7R8CZT0_LEPSM|nr:unnamed protein product [Lepeophtheirus salmonis]CAF2953102.1 unnamed protein product [Lepeophtheirus salmonis]
MGTQFSKIKVTQRVEYEGKVLHFKEDYYGRGQGSFSDEEEEDDEEIYTRRSHHSGIISGHELMSYTFLGGQACRPRRSVRRRHRYKGFVTKEILASKKERRKKSFEDEVVDKKKYLDMGYCSSHDSSTGSTSSRPESELDSGSNTVSESHLYEIPSIQEDATSLSTEALTFKDGDFIKVEVLQEDEKKKTTHTEEEEEKVEMTEEMTDILKRYYRDNFCDWFQPGTIVDGNKTSQSLAVYRRSSRKKSLHQKLVLSQYASSPSSKQTKGFSSAIKLDMDDRAKMIQYFSTKENGKSSKEMSVKIEDMFVGARCWSLPRPGPSVPTIITVQAPAGIGKSSMLKYMCMKWGCQELWNSNFDVIAFVECRTLNRLGPLTGKEFLKKILLDPVKDLRNKYGVNEFEKETEGDEETKSEGFDSFFQELALKAATGRVLLLLDGLDEVHGVANLNNIPLGTIVHNGRNGTKEISSSRKHSHYYYDIKLTPLEFTQLLLTGSILGGCFEMVPILTQKRLVSLDIQGLSDEGVQSFIHSYVDARQQYMDRISLSEDERPSTNPFYLWLICTIFSETGEEFVPKTLTQLYTWVMLVFAHRWQNTSLQLTSMLEEETVSFLLGFARLCYHLVRTGNIKMSARLVKNETEYRLFFPDLGNDVSIDQERAETFGLMTVSQNKNDLECEFRHLSLAEYLTALHVHVTGDSLQGFPRDRKELILQYLSGLASSSTVKDQIVVQEFLLALGSSHEIKDPLSYLKIVQKNEGRMV